MKSVAIRLGLMALLGSVAFSQAQYKVLWNFQESPDGASPRGDIIADEKGNLYGTTYFGGDPSCTLSCGTVFELSPGQNGVWSETVLYSFCPILPCSDGAQPSAGLLLDKQGNLYGTTYSGGSQPCPIQSTGCGTVFELSPSRDGQWTETVLWQFCSVNVNDTCLDGALPVSQLTMDTSGSLYGSTFTGGVGGSRQVDCCVGGTVFELSPSENGWVESVLYNFCPAGPPICLDGTGPLAGVTFDKAGNLYGTTQAGGAPASLGGGTIYKLTPGLNGWTETVLLASRAPFHAKNLPKRQSVSMPAADFTRLSKSAEHSTTGQ